MAFGPAAFSAITRATGFEYQHEFGHWTINKQSPFISRWGKHSYTTETLHAHRPISSLVSPSTATPAPCTQTERRGIWLRVAIHALPAPKTQVT